MASETTATDLVLGVPKSNNDRPFPVRATRAVGHFMISKPLGGFGIVVILIVVAMAVLRSSCRR